MIKSYSEMEKFNSFEERYDYLRLSGSVGETTFGFDRYLNQIFYRSNVWKLVRDKVIIRDQGCDLGIDGREIVGRILIHHMNPVTMKDIEMNNDNLLDPEFLVCVSHNTHNAIHYGSKELLISDPIVRTRNDTCPWVKK